MNNLTQPNAFATLTEPATLTIQRFLPGTIDRVWAYLTDGELRRKWLASGDMSLRLDAPFEFVWRNDELTDPPGRRPDGFATENRMQSRIIEIDPPRKLVISWGESGEVSFSLESKGDQVLLTLIHKRAGNRERILMFSAGWHMHLDILAARMSGENTEPFWDGWMRLKTEYDRRIPI